MINHDIRAERAARPRPMRPTASSARWATPGRIRAASQARPVVEQNSSHGIARSISSQRPSSWSAQAALTTEMSDVRNGRSRSSVTGRPADIAGSRPRWTEEATTTPPRLQ